MSVNINIYLQIIQWPLVSYWLKRVLLSHRRLTEHTQSSFNTNVTHKYPPEEVSVPWGFQQPEIK